MSICLFVPDEIMMLFLRLVNNDARPILRRKLNRATTR